MHDSPLVFFRYIAEHPGTTLSDIWRNTGLKTYSHILRMTDDAEKAGFIDRAREGRCNHVTLTEKGRELEDHLRKIKMLLGQRDDLIDPDDLIDSTELNESFRSSHHSPTGRRIHENGNDKRKRRGIRATADEKHRRAREGQHRGRDKDENCKSGHT